MKKEDTNKKVYALKPPQANKSKQKIISALVLSAFGVSLATGFLYRFLDKEEITAKKQTSASPNISNVNGSIGLYTTYKTVYVGQKTNFPTLYTNLDTAKITNNNNNNNNKNINTSVLASLPNSHTITYYWYEDDRLINTTNTPSLTLTANDFYNSFANNININYNFKVVAVAKNDTSNYTLASKQINISLVNTNTITIKGNGCFYQNDENVLVAEPYLLPYYQNESLFKQVLNAGTITNKGAINKTYTWYVAYIQNASELNKDLTFTKLNINTQTLNITNDLFFKDASGNEMFGYYEFKCVINADMENGASLQENSSNVYTIQYVKPGQIGLSVNWTKSNTYYGVLNDANSVNDLDVTASYTPIGYSTQQATFTYTWQELNASGQVIKSVNNVGNSLNIGAIFPDVFKQVGTYYFKVVVSGNFLGSVLEDNSSIVYTLDVLDPVFKQSNYTSSYNYVTNASQNAINSLDPQITVSGFNNNKDLNTSVIWSYRTSTSSTLNDLNYHSLVLNSLDVYNTLLNDENMIKVATYTFYETVIYTYNLANGQTITKTFNATYTIHVLPLPTMSGAIQGTSNLNYLIGQKTSITLPTYTFNIKDEVNELDMSLSYVWEYKTTNDSNWVYIANTKTNLNNEQNNTYSNTLSMPWNEISNNFLKTAGVYTIRLIIYNTIDATSNLAYDSNSTNENFVLNVYPKVSFNVVTPYTSQIGFANTYNSIVAPSYSLSVNNNSYLTSLMNDGYVKFSYQWYYCNKNDYNSANPTLNAVLLDPDNNIYNSYYNTTDPTSVLESAMFSQLNAGSYDVFCVISYSIESLGIDGEINNITPISLTLYNTPTITATSNIDSATGYTDGVLYIMHMLATQNGQINTNAWINEVNTVDVSLKINDSIDYNGISDISFKYKWINNYNTNYNTVNSSVSGLNAISFNNMNASVSFNPMDASNYIEGGYNTNGNLNYYNVVVFMVYKANNQNYVIEIPVSNNVLKTSLVGITLEAGEVKNQEDAFVTHSNIKTTTTIPNLKYQEFHNNDKYLSADSFMRTKHFTYKNFFPQKYLTYKDSLWMAEGSEGVMVVTSKNTIHRTIPLDSINKTHYSIANYHSFHDLGGLHSYNETVHLYGSIVNTTNQSNELWSCALLFGNYQLFHYSISYKMPTITKIKWIRHESHLWYSNNQTYHGWDIFPINTQYVVAS